LNRREINLTLGALVNRILLEITFIIEKNLVKSIF
jgi:hypothetical protein